MHPGQDQFMMLEYLEIVQIFLEFHLVLFVIVLMIYNIVSVSI